MALEYLAAVLIQLAATSLTNVGFAIEKKAADALPKIEEAGGAGSFKNFLSSRAWVVGFMFVNVGALLALVAVALAPLSLVMPLQGAGLAVLALFSRFYLKEDVRGVEYGGVALAGLSVVMIGLVPAQEGQLSAAETFEALYGPVGLVFFVLISIVVVVLYFWGRAADFKHAGFAFATGAGVAAAVGFTLSKGFTTPLAELGLGGTLALPLAWLSLGLYAIPMILSTALGQWAFQKGKAVVCTPTQTVFQILVPIVSGALLFGELAGRTPGELALYGVALGLMIVAVLVLGIAAGLRLAKIPTPGPDVPIVLGKSSESRESPSSTESHDPAGPPAPS